MPSNSAASGHTPSQNWTTIITPHRGWFDWRLGVLWRYRDLVTLFVWRDFTAVYRQTILGPAWHLVQPIVTTLTFTVVFNRVARLSTDGIPPLLFYLAGTVAWTYFASTLTQASTTFVTNASLLGKVYFHRLTLPISVVVSNLVSFGIQFSLLMAATIAYKVGGAPIHVSWAVLLLPLLLALLAGYALGTGIIVSALTTRYRDLARLVTFGVQLGMFLTPVVYPLSTVPANLRPFVELNPLTFIMEGFRMALFGVGTVTAANLAATTVGMLCVLTVGLMLFTHVERTFTDTI